MVDVTTVFTCGALGAVISDACEADDLMKAAPNQKSREVQTSKADRRSFDKNLEDRSWKRFGLNPFLFFIPLKGEKFPVLSASKWVVR